MAEEGRETQLDDLPEDILVSKILVLLPPKDVGRCRAVRSSWRSATSTPEFMLDHHRLQPSLPVVEGEGGHLGVLRGGSVDSMAYQPLWTLLPWADVHAASHGFLIVSHCQLGSRFYICNPAIRQIAPLPQPEFRLNNAVLGLYRHDATGEYRLLWSSVCFRNEIALHVLTVGDTESRNIGLPAASTPSLQHAVLDALPRGPCTAYNPPVHHRGNLHWLPWMPTCRAKIVAFDTATESFRLMRNVTNSNGLEKLFDLEGKLALSSHDSRLTYMDVWVMGDYAAEIWDLKFRIDVSSIQVSLTLNLASPKKENKRQKKMGTHVAPRFLDELVMVNERELLAGFGDNHVLRCDIDDKLLGMANIKGQCYMELTPLRFKQSILPIPLSGMPEDKNYVNGRFPAQEHVGTQ